MVVGRRTCCRTRDVRSGPRWQSDGDGPHRWLREDAWIVGSQSHAGRLPNAARIVVAMADDLDVEVIGDDPLVDGMTLSLRLRRDFTVTDASRLLTTARRLYLELNQDSSADEAVEMVTCAADALFVLLEHAGVLGAVADGLLAGHAANGLAVEGQVAQVVLNEPYPLSPHRRGNCLRGGDLFALPSNDNDESR
jgi:hypothetical protein